MSAQPPPPPPPGVPWDAAMWARILTEARPMLDAFLRLHGHASPTDQPVLLPEPIGPDEDGARLLTWILTGAADRIAAADQATAEGEG